MKNLLFTIHQLTNYLLIISHYLFTKTADELPKSDY